MKAPVVGKGRTRRYKKLLLQAKPRSVLSCKLWLSGMIIFLCKSLKNYILERYPQNFHKYDFLLTTTNTLTFLEL